jgi:hypothetical protein
MTKRVVSVSLGSTSRDHRVVTQLLGQEIIIERIGTNGDEAKAKKLYEELDGQVDCLGVGGAVLSFSAVDRSYTMPGVYRLIQNVHRTPVVDGTGFKSVMERRLAAAVDREIGAEVEKRTALIASAADRMGQALSFAEAGYELAFGDLMFALGVPIVLRSMDSLKTVMHILGPIVRHLPMSLLYPTGEREDVNTPRYEQWFRWAGVIAGDCNYIAHYMPLDMRNKIIATNTTTPRDVELFRSRGVRYLVTSTPRLEGRTFGTNLMECVLVALAGQGRALRPAEVEALLEELGWRPNIEKLNS